MAKRQKQKEKSGFLSGFMLGSLIGAVLALLFAPQSGERTRDQLLGDQGMLRRPIQEQVDGVLALGRATYAQTRATIREAIDEGRVEAERTRRELHRKYQEQTGQS